MVHFRIMSQRREYVNVIIDISYHPFLRFYQRHLDQMKTIFEQKEYNATG